MSEFRIRREDPPAPSPRGRRIGSGAGKIDKEVAAFKKHAGQWFKVREGASAGAYQVYKKRGCEVRTKHVGDNKYDIWCMYPKDAE